MPELRLKHGISSATIYKWRSKFNGMDASLMAQMKELEEKNRRLKKMYAKQGSLFAVFVSGYGLFLDNNLTSSKYTKVAKVLCNFSEITQKILRISHDIRLF